MKVDRQLNKETNPNQANNSFTNHIYSRCFLSIAAINQTGSSTCPNQGIASLKEVHRRWNFFNPLIYTSSLSLDKNQSLSLFYCDPLHFF